MEFPAGRPGRRTRRAAWRTLRAAETAHDCASAVGRELDSPAGAEQGRLRGALAYVLPHRLVRAPIVLVWDRLNTHVSHAIRELITEPAWLTVFLPPAYSPDLNPVEWVWAHAKRSLANLAVVALDRLETLVRNRLKRLQYRPDTLDGFIAGTGLTLDAPTSP
ncbi:transposase [Streptomyces rhizosphaerihabitans]|uniref:transposase n=1 Tax=Streptomyces rhizosphaerihabitans TaxID=1266770 RepID=UPI0021BE7CF8|nr:transposase [Streptomyces rhizosphaerihabitans]MCT9010490.1 transposase [Streptomyces rhizosphaerihabitans]